MSNDVNPNGADNSSGDSAPAGGRAPSSWVLDDIGHGFVQLRPPSRLDEVPFPPEDPEDRADYDWAHDDADVRARYAGLVVAVRHKPVWGAGRTFIQAHEDAARKPGCPRDLVYVYVWPNQAGGTNRTPTS